MQSPIAFDRPLALLLIPAMLWLFWLIARRSYAGLHPQTALLALAVRAVAIVLLTLAIAGLHVVKQTDKLTTIFLVDVSKSIRPDQRARGIEYVREALAKKHHDDAGGIIVFGRSPYLEEPVSSSLQDVGDLHAAVAGDATDIQDALRLAEASFPNDSGRKIVIVSDGNENIGDAASEIDSLRMQGIRVDIAPTALSLDKNGQTQGEALVDGVDIPTHVRKSAPFTVKVVVSSTVPQTANLTLTQDGRGLSTERVDLHAGKNAFNFQEKIADPGFHRYDVQLDPSQDQIAENNHAYGFVTVQARPRVLYVAEPDEPVDSFKRAMAAQEIDVDVTTPGAIPASVAGLESYDSIILSNVSADEVGAPAMAGIEEAVRDFGLGLGMVGGTESYAAGGYIGTPVEEALPVNMEVKDRKRIPPAAIALVIEDLEEPTSVNWSVEAAKAAVDLMEPQDMVGVLDCNGQWRIPMQKVVDKNAIKAQMDDLTGMNDPPTYDPYLEQAAGVLASSNAPIKHIIFFGDGDAVSEGPQSVDVIKAIHKQGITVSTIASGADEDGIKFLQAIAQLGGGRSYIAEKATDLPGLLMKDQQTATRQYVIEKPFVPRSYAGDDVIAGIDWSAAPPLLGYNVASRKPGATVALTATDESDPVFAHWRYGLGRTFAFTSDDRPHWAAEWLPWDGYAKFWAQAVRWSLKSNSGGDFHAMVDNSDGKGHVVVDAFSQDTGFINGAKLTAKVVAPDQTVSSVSLSQTAPGRYEGNFDTDQTGAYMVNVRRDNGDPSGPPPPSETVGLAVPYSPEYRTITPNLPLLTRLTEGTGGSFQNDPARIFRDAPAWIVGTVDFAPSLLAFTALLFLFDIAVRRLGIRLQKVAASVVEGVEAGASKIDQIRKARQPVTASTAQMSQLLQRKTASRGSVEEDEAALSNRLLNRRAASRSEAGDDPFPQVARLRTPPSNAPKPTGEGSGYTNRLLEAKRRAQHNDED